MKNKQCNLKTLSNNFVDSIRTLVRPFSYCIGSLQEYNSKNTPIHMFCKHEVAGDTDTVKKSKNNTYISFKHNLLNKGVEIADAVLKYNKITEYYNSISVSPATSTLQKYYRGYIFKTVISGVV